tara:strand:+ start:365 stop:556 length:192 start_codon:yes stop_codon:yes gene_type:complete
MEREILPMTDEEAKEVALEIIGAVDESEISDRGAYNHHGQWCSDKTMYHRIIKVLTDDYLWSD